MPVPAQVRPIPVKERKTSIDAMLLTAVPMTLVTLLLTLPQAMSVLAQALRLLVLLPTIQVYQAIMPVQVPVKRKETNWPVMVLEEQPVLMLEMT